MLMYNIVIKLPNPELYLSAYAIVGVKVLHQYLAPRTVRGLVIGSRVELEITNTCMNVQYACQMFIQWN